jgi:hypothetical protein
LRLDAQVWKTDLPHLESQIPERQSADRAGDRPRKAQIANNGSDIAEHRTSRGVAQKRWWITVRGPNGERGGGVQSFAEVFHQCTQKGEVLRIAHAHRLPT